MSSLPNAATKNNDGARVVLASQSPRRRELLDQIGLAYRVLAVDIDESIRSGESADDYVIRLAGTKALAGARADGTALPVIGADTSVVSDGAVLGKPRDGADACVMLRRLSGREHDVLTAVALYQPGIAARPDVRLSASRVRMRQIREEEIAAYVATEEPLDKAGAYAIQGRAGAFVESLSGSYSGVVGLPLFDLDLLLKRAEINLWEPRG